MFFLSKRHYTPTPLNSAYIPSMGISDSDHYMCAGYQGYAGAVAEGPYTPMYCSSHRQEYARIPGDSHPRNTGYSSPSLPALPYHAHHHG